MARMGKVYRGPQVSFGRRFALKYSGLAAVLLGLLWGCLFLGSIFSGWRRPDGALLLIVVLAGMLSLVAMWATWERGRLVRETPLPRFLRRKLMDTYPHLTLRDTELVERGLRQFFIACQRSNKRFVAMPSQVVDSMWHEFILHTSAYREWCDLVIGRFIDHVPAEVLGRKASTNDGLRRAWFWSCRDESINPRQPSRLPLLFALDAKFAIPGGFIYMADCKGVRREGDQGGGAYCGESFSDGSYSGDADGFGGSDSSSSGGDGSSSGSSDGSSGCGSGCGGGGD